MKAVIDLNEAGEEKEACLPLPFFFVVCVVWQVLFVEGVVTGSGQGGSKSCRRTPIRSGDEWENRQLSCMVVCLSFVENPD